MESELGAGGMAVVYRAKHILLHRICAIKALLPALRLDPNVRSRFLSEALIGARLVHPNIVRVEDTISTPEVAALVMEYVDGPSLDAYIRQRKARPSADQIRSLFVPVLEAVGFAHENNVVHRDLKPDNILLAAGPRGIVPKVTDFGIAKARDFSLRQRKKSTALDARMGTTGYMSPEQIQKSKEATERSDIFSLGATLYELATLQPAFEGTSDYDVMHKVMHAHYPPLAGVESSIATAIVRALEPDPARRFSTCAEFARALAAPKAKPKDETKTGARTPGRGRSSHGLPWRLVVTTVGAIGLLLGALSLTLVLARGSPQTGASLPICPPGMTGIPGGMSWAGSLDAQAGETGPHWILVAPYCIDTTEISVERYAECSSAGACAPAPSAVNYSGLSPSEAAFWSQFCNGNRPDRQQHPVNCVDWNQADTYCRWADRRLPSEAEWEYAARGTDGRPYPWGTSPPDASRLNACGQECKLMLVARGKTWQAMYEASDGWDSTAPVGAFPAGASPFGVLDLAGNVWEWTSDTPEESSEAAATAASASANRVCRGGGWSRFNPRGVTTTARTQNVPAFRSYHLGFRCARRPL